MKTLAKSFIETSNVIFDKITIHQNHLANSIACVEDCTIGDSLLSIPYFDKLQDEDITVFCGKNINIFKYFLPQIKTIEINAEPFTRNPQYRHRKLEEAFGEKCGCKKVVVTSPHRTDRIVKAAKMFTANEKYLYYGQKVISKYRNRAIEKGFKIISNPYLNSENRVDAHGDYHLRTIFSSAFHRKIELHKEDFIGFYSKFKDKDFPVKDYTVLITDSAAPYRRYPQEKWQQVLDNLPKNQRIIVLGVTPIHLEHPTLRNLVGKTNLIESIKLVQNASLVIGNETGLTHLGYLSGVPTVCVLGAGLFGGFLPWAEFEGLVHCVYKDMECKGCNWYCKYVDALKGNLTPCFEIEPDEVLEKIRLASAMPVVS
jgi:ADP-heptose:LPS heptosyltransferase